MPRWLGPAVAGLVVLGALALWLQRGGTAAESPEAVSAGATSTVGSVNAAPSSNRPDPDPQTAASSVPQAPSWNGTAVDGDIHLDGRGNLVPDRALRNLFDYLLTARGELSMDQIKQRLAAAGQDHRLDAAQLVQLSSMFARYLDYLDALPQVALQGTDVDSLRRTYEARRALRRGALGVEMAEGFFAEEEARDRYEIDVIAIRRDQTLTAEARGKALAELRQAEAPPALSAVDQRSATVVDLAAETDRLRAAGADAAAIQALREREVGSEAAARLAALDAERAQWQERVSALRNERDRILADTSFAVEDRQHQVDELIARDFSAEEAVRVRAQLGNTAPPGTP